MPHTRGVYSLADHPTTPATRARLAVASVGRGAALSGAGAAWWHGLLDEPPKKFTVTAPRSRHGSPVEGVRVRRRCLADAEVVTRKELLVTALPLSVLDAALESDSGAPLSLSSAASSTDSGKAVTSNSLRVTTSASARQRRRTRTPSTGEPCRDRGAVTVNFFGGSSRSPCHHAAPAPDSAAPRPTLATASRARVAGVVG